MTFEPWSRSANSSAYSVVATGLAVGAQVAVVRSKFKSSKWTWYQFLGLPAWTTEERMP